MISRFEDNTESIVRTAHNIFPTISSPKHDVFPNRKAGLEFDSELGGFKQVSHLVTDTEWLLAGGVEEDFKALGRSREHRFSRSGALNTRRASHIFTLSSRAWGEVAAVPISFDLKVTRERTPLI